MRLAALLLALAGALSGAEDGGQAAAWTKLAVDARSAGLARAVSALPDDAGAIQMDPALLATQGRVNLGSCMAVLPDGRSLQFVGLGRPFSSGSPWSWGLSYLQYSQGAELERRQANTPSPDGYFRESSSQTQASLAYWLLERKLAVGLGVKVLSYALGEASAGGLSADLGAFWRASPWMDLGFALRDPSSRLVWTSGHVEALPLQVRAGAALHPWGERLNFLLEADRSSAQEARLHLGAEAWAWAEHLAFRAGFDDGLWVAGLGARARLFELATGLDYAFTADRASSELQHRFSLHLGFDL